MLKRLASLLLVSFVAACGGGGGDAGTPPFGGGTGSTPASATLTATISSPDVTAATPATVTLTVKDASGNALAGQVVNLATTVGALDVDSVLTDASGSATTLVRVNPSGAAGAGEVTATAVVGTATLTAKVGYRVTATATVPTVVEMVASSNSVGTGGGDITITAVVKGAGNVVVPGTSVQFSTDSGTLTNAATVTDGNGAATVKFSAGADKSNRVATITVSAGSVSGSIGIDVTGTTLSYLGTTTLTLGSPAEVVTITARDAKGAGIAGIPLSVVSSLGNVPAGTSITTDSAGVAKLTYVPNVAGTDTLTILGLGETLTKVLSVIGQDFAFTSPTASEQINISASKDVSVRYLVNGAVPVGAFTVRFTTTAGTFDPTSASTTGVALVGGSASAKVSSTFAGPATIQASLYADSAPTVVVAQATLTIGFVATTPTGLTLQVSPSAIGPNASGSTSQVADVQATVIDAFSNPVANVVVNFSRIADPSGGNLSQPSALTNDNGVATVKYYSGAQSTATNGVELKAVLASNSNVTGSATLTVNQSALFIALGTGNEISNGDPANTTYLKVWTVYVTDASGAAVPNVTLTISALPKNYGKGSFAWNGTLWDTTVVSAPAIDPSPVPNLFSGLSIVCPSEDALLGSTAPQTHNGVLDPGEDVNGSGKLEPGNVISVNSGTSITTVKTDATGFATINLRYAESYAYWVQVGLKASAIVAGTESSNEAVFWAPGMASDYSSETVAPAGAISPFGTQMSCKAPN